MDDATLVSRAAGGDRDAFAAVYDAYGGAVLDLCTAVLRDGDEAAEATLDAFLRAARELVNLRDRSRLRLWLLAVARHEATVRAERPVPAGPVAGEESEPDEAGERTASAPGADDPRQQVWDPLQSLSEQDRTILHLHLRHQLDAEELGAVLGLRAVSAGDRAARLRRRAEGSVGALLLSRADGGVDPASCPGLSAVLDGWDGRFTEAVGARVDRHVRRCEVCRGRRTMLLDRLRAMASLPFLPPPDWLRREVLIRMELAVSSRPLPGWAEDGFPPGIAGPARRRRPRRRSVAVAVAALVVVLAGVGFLLVRDDGGRSTLTASGSPASSRPPVASTVTSTVRGPATSAVTAALTAPTVAPSTSPPSTSPGPPTTPAPVGPGPTVPPIAVDRDPPTISFGADVASLYTSGCPYSATGVSADVTDQSAVTWVALVVRGPDGGEVTVPMSAEGGGHWRATMGEFAFAGQAGFRVEAFDSEGNQARSADQVLDVFQCE